MKHSVADMLMATAAIAVLAGCAGPGAPGQGVLPGIVIEQGPRTLRIDGEVCIGQGILEYAAVADGGKTYESLFSMHCRPSHLQVAMLMTGYEAGELEPALRGDFAPDADPAAHPPPEGAPRVQPPAQEYWETASAKPARVTIDVEVRQADGSWKRQPIESFLIDRRTARPPPRLTWAFTGSFFHKDRQSGLEYFVADTEKSLIALWYDPTALLNLTCEVGNPYRGQRVGFEVNEKQVPQKGTEARLILHPEAKTP